jgi:uncharacterized protein
MTSVGRDSQLDREPADQTPVVESHLVRWIVACVRWYQRVLSPLKRTATCRYLPTCSEYAVEAVRIHGAVLGCTWAVMRILRCNPLFHAGYHPVHKSRSDATCGHEGPN